MRRDNVMVQKSELEWSNQIMTIRVLAILLVVFGHSIILYSSSWNLYSTVNDVPILDYVKKIIDIIQMPIFFSISGYLFLYTHRKRAGILRLIKIKMKRLLIPYFIIGFVYMVPIKLLIGYSGYRGKNLFDLFLNFLKGEDVGHLWFLPALFWIFVISEVALSAIEIIPFVKRYSAIILLLFSVGLYLEGYRISFGYNPFLAAFSYMIWFSCGYLICAYQNVIRKLYSSRIIKYIGVLISIWLIFICSYNDTRIIVELCAKSLCILNLYMLIPQKENESINIVSKDSFGIYLFHSPLIYFTYSLIPNANPLIVVLLNFVVFGLVSIGITEGIRRLKFGFIIGE